MAEQCIVSVSLHYENNLLGYFEETWNSSFCWNIDSSVEPPDVQTNKHIHYLNGIKWLVSMPWYCVFLLLSYPLSQILCSAPCLHFMDQSLTPVIKWLIPPVALTPPLCQWTYPAKSGCIKAQGVHIWVRLMIALLLWCAHITFQYYENLPVEMKFLDKYKLKFSLFYNSNMWCLHQCLTLMFFFIT